jgi:anti-sigma-K factor RskA
MTHSEMDELYELYLLGVLELPEAAEIREHLNRNCEYCLSRIRESSAVVASLASLAEPVAPPTELKERILAVASPVRKQKRLLWPAAFAIACAATIAGVMWGIGERGTIDETLKRLEDVSRQRNELRSALAILSESDTRTVAFGGQQAGPHGRLFLSHNGGVVFVGGKLPELASGKTFQLWLVPAKGNPKSAGLFTPNAEGISVNVLAQSINPSEYAAVAVSVEPDGGSPQPTTKPIIVVPLA